MRSQAASQYNAHGNDLQYGYCDESDRVGRGRVVGHTEECQISSTAVPTPEQLKILSPAITDRPAHQGM